MAAFCKQAVAVSVEITHSRTPRSVSALINILLCLYSVGIIFDVKGSVCVLF